MKQGYAQFGHARCKQGLDVLTVEEASLEPHSEDAVKEAQAKSWLLVRAQHGLMGKGFIRAVAPASVTILPDGQRFVGILWAGGWDDYVVDCNQVRDMTAEEIAACQAATDKGFGLPSIVSGSWLHGHFIEKKFPGQISNTQCIKVIQHLGGGD